MFTQTYMQYQAQHMKTNTNLLLLPTTNITLFRHLRNNPLTTKQLNKNETKT